MSKRRWSPWGGDRKYDKDISKKDTALVVALSARFPSTEVPLLMDIVSFIRERDECLSWKCDAIWQAAESLPCSAYEWAGIDYEDEEDGE